MREGGGAIRWVQSGRNGRLCQEKGVKKKKRNRFRKKKKMIKNNSNKLFSEKDLIVKNQPILICFRWGRATLQGDENIIECEGG